MNSKNSDMIDVIKDLLFSGKAEHIEVFFNKVMQCDFIVASANSERQAKGLLQKIVGYLKNNTDYTYRLEGENKCNWVIIDILDLELMIHIFRTEVREYYKVDSFWNPDLHKTS
ncbi:ribosome silencing factor [Anaplasmataceae bacterium AB001_6]|nr:ribosome silencing factor [Anaplasmataceae bacterium AB001_6]